MTTLAFFIVPSQAAEERGFWLMLLVIPTICWLLVRLRKWLGVIAVPIALFTACYCLISVNSAITDRVREGPGYSIPWTRGFPDYGFIALAFAAAALPFIAIRTAYMWPRKGPNPEGCVRPERSGAVNTTFVEQARERPETKAQPPKD